jgi:hypothetical protein
MTDLAKKLRIKEGDALITVNAPVDFHATLGPLPAGVRITKRRLPSIKSIGSWPTGRKWKRC